MIKVDSVPGLKVLLEVFQISHNGEIGEVEICTILVYFLVYFMNGLYDTLERLNKIEEDTTAKIALHGSQFLRDVLTKHCTQFKDGYLKEVAKMRELKAKMEKEKTPDEVVDEVISKLEIKNDIQKPVA
jgi:hypothetical protein